MKIKKTSNSMESNEHSRILNYPNYFMAGNGQMDFGIHGPEVIEGKLFISIYHYLEYIDISPRKYDTFSLGRYLTSRSSKYLKCKYGSQNFEINKFELELLKEETGEFDNFRR